MSDQVPVVYYKPGCPFWQALYVKLLLSRTPFRKVRFRDDEEGAAAVRAVNDGNEISPTVRVGEVWLTNPTLKAVRAALTS